METAPHRSAVARAAARATARPAAPEFGAPTRLLARSASSPLIEETEQLEGTDASPWVCIVWDDPVNLMSYVTFVLQRTFGYDRPKAHDLMLAVHNDGKAAVATGSRDEMENAVRKLQEAGLWATLQKGE